MSPRTRRSFAAIVAVTVALAAGPVWGIYHILGQTKDELKLNYDVAVQDHGTGRVTIVLTLADEGRLAPLDDVQLAIPGKDTTPSGGRWMDLVVSVRMREGDDGTRVGRVHILRELAERAVIRFTSHTMDDKEEPLTGLMYVIPLAEYLKDSPAAPEQTPQ